MREFIGTDELKDARVRDSDVSGAQFRGVNFSNVTITNAWLFNTDISGMIGGLKINTVEVEPLIEAELDRRHPERTKLRPTDVDGLRTAFDVVEEMWAQTMEHARRLPQSKLHERVGREYSFVETLRHLLFATDAWLVRMVPRVPNAYHEWAVPPDLPPDAPPDTGPELDAVLAVRAERIARIGDYLSSATQADLSSRVSAPDPTGHPQGTHRVLDCFRVVLREEWWHNATPPATFRRVLVESLPCRGPRSSHATDRAIPRRPAARPPLSSLHRRAAIGPPGNRHRPARCERDGTSTRVSSAPSRLTSVISPIVSFGIGENTDADRLQNVHPRPR